MRRARALATVAGVLSVAAALVHGVLTPTHFEEFWGYGVFFAVAATAQIVLALALFVPPFESERAQRAIYAAGAAGQIVLIAFYLFTRLVGIPFFGPGAGEVEVVSPIDVVAQVAEAGCAALLVYAFVATRPRATPPS